MIDTAGTIVQGAQACADKGAREVWTACTHAVLSGPALERLQQSCLTQVIIDEYDSVTGKSGCARRSINCRWRRCWARRSDGSMRMSRSVRCLPSRQDSS